MPTIPTGTARVQVGLPGRAPDPRGVTDTAIRGIGLVERAFEERANQERESRAVRIKGDIERQMLELEAGLGQQTSAQGVMDYFESSAESIRENVMASAGDDESLRTVTEDMLINRATRASARALSRRDLLNAEATAADQLRASDTYEAAYASAGTEQELDDAAAGYALALRVRLDADPSYGEDDFQKDIDVWRARAQTSRVLTLDQTQGEVAARAALADADALDSLQKSNLAAHIGLESRRRQQAVERARTEAQRVDYNTMVERFADPEQPDPTVSDILSSRLSGPQKEHFLAVADDKAGGGNPNAIDYEIVNPIGIAIELGHITSEEQLQAAVLPFIGRGVPLTEYGKFRERIAAINKPEEKAVSGVRSDFFKNAERQIANPDMFGAIADPLAAERFYQFKRFAETALDASENPLDLLDPNNPAYLGAYIQQYRVGLKDSDEVFGSAFSEGLPVGPQSVAPTLPVTDRMKELDAIANGSAK